MNLWRTLIGFLLAISLAQISVASEMNAMQWLDKMSHSARELNYDGNFIYLQGEQLSSLRVVHAVEDGIERERLVHLDGEHREVVRNGHEISCIHPGESMMRLDHSIPSGPYARHFFGDVGKIESNYRLVMAGSERVANREAEVVALEPKDQWRYGYRLSLDRETGLLLQSRVLSRQGMDLERFQFVSIIIGEKVDPSALEPASGGYFSAHHHLPQNNQNRKPGLDWYPGWVPEGFMMSASNRPASHNRQSGDSMMFTDGLAEFSVFMERPSSGKRGEGVMSKGATVVFSLDTGGQGGNYIVTVVGEIPVQAARKIARSVQAGVER